MSIPQAFIQELLARTDVVDVIGRYVQLKKGGANFMGLCPFHGEKSASFSVSPSKQFYHCFGCGKNGDALRFLMEHAGMSFVEAVQDLAQACGLQVPESSAFGQDPAQASAQREKQTTLHAVLEQACTAYKEQLKRSTKAKNYFKNRGLSGETARQFGLGYAPDGWRTLAGVFPRYDDPLLLESGLVVLQNDETTQEEKRYDRFRDRVMFPIRNIKGQCIGFGGRVLGDDKPKYLNSPETPVFNKGRELYGLFEARAALRERGFALVTEGYMDVLMLAQHGFANSVATLGTACTTDHVQKLFRFTDAVVFGFDGDEAGQRAAHKALRVALPFATDRRSIKFLFLPSEHDPDSFIRAHGQAAFATCIAQATPLSQFLLAVAREKCDLQSAEGRARMVSQAQPLWALLPEGALKQQLLGDLAREVKLSNAELAELWMPTHPTPTHKRFQPWVQRGQAEVRRLGPSARVPIAKPRLPDHAARLLLHNMAALETLSAEDHNLLCALPAPYGALFVWLDHQLHEHGPQPWAALREGLRGHAAEELATRLMNHQDSATVDAPASDELRHLLNRMQIEQLKAQETEAAQQAAQADPSAAQRYREIQTRRVALEAKFMAH